MKESPGGSKGSNVIWSSGLTLVPSVIKGPQSQWFANEAINKLANKLLILVNRNMLLLEARET